MFSCFRVKLALDALKNMKVDEKVVKLFQCLSDIMEDTSENPLAKKTAATRQTWTNRKPKPKKPGNIIDAAMREAQKKYDSIEEIVKKGDEHIEKYIKDIVKEVKCGYYFNKRL